MRISDWSSDVCSSDLVGTVLPKADAMGVDDIGVDRLHRVIIEAKPLDRLAAHVEHEDVGVGEQRLHAGKVVGLLEVERDRLLAAIRSEEHTSGLQSLMRISYAVFCLKKKNNKAHKTKTR